MTRSEFIDKVAKDNGQTMVATKAWVDVVLAELAEVVTQEDEVDLRGLGRFEHKNRKAKVGRNASTGEKIDIPARVVVKFYPGSLVDSAVKKLPLLK